MGDYWYVKYYLIPFVIVLVIGLAIGGFILYYVTHKPGNEFTGNTTATTQGITRNRAAAVEISGRYTKARKTITRHSSSVTEHQRTTKPPTPGPSWPSDAASILHRLNLSADPCNDFYNFACGGWISRHPLTVNTTERSIKDAQQMAIDNRTITELYNVDLGRLAISSAWWKAAFSYRACDAAHSEPDPKNRKTLGLLQNLGGWPIITKNWTYGSNFSELLAIITRTMDVQPFFSLTIKVDPINPERYIVFLEQGSLILREPRLYDKGRFPDLYEKYLDLFIAVAVILGRDAGIDVSDETFQQHATDMAEYIYDLEQDLAATMQTIPKADTVFDYGRSYHAYTFDQLKNLFTFSQDWNWETYFLMTLPQNVQWYYQHYDSKFASYQAKYLKSISDVLNNYDSRTITNYLFSTAIMKLLDLGYIRDTSTNDAHSQIRHYNPATTIKTQRQQETCISIMHRLIPQAVTSLYVTKSSPSQPDFEGIAGIIGDIKSAFLDVLPNIQWLDADSRSAISQKLTNMRYLLGYESWIINKTALNRFHQDLVVDPMDDWLAIFGKLSNFSNRKQFQALNLNPTAVFLTCPLQVTEADYSYTQNYMAVPLSMLSEPFYSLDYPKAHNYGSLGWYIARGISKAFDAEGIQFDSEGSLTDLMTSASRQGFTTTVDCLINQYQQLCQKQAISRTDCVNGTATLNSNMADNFASQYSIRAYRNYISKYGHEALLPGLRQFTMDQVVFMTMATNLCQSSNKGFIAETISNGAMPDSWRLNSALVNLKLFSSVYNCNVGSRMNPSNRCSVWQ